MVVQKNWSDKSSAMASMLLAVLVTLVLCPIRVAAQEAQEQSDADAQTQQDEAEVMQRAFDARKQQQEQAQTTDVLQLKLSGNDISIETLSSGEIVIIGNERDLDIIEQFIAMLDREPPEKEFVLHYLNNVGADQVAQKLQDIASQIYPGMEDVPDQRISVIAVASNVLLIVAPTNRVQRMVDLAKAIDEVEVQLPEFEAMKFIIKYRKAGEVAEQLKQIIDKLKARQEAKATEEITVEINDADNSIIIFGPPTLRRQIQMLIDQIDIEPTTEFSSVKLAFFPLFNAVADDLAKVLTDMLASSAGQADVQETIRRLSIIKREADGTLSELEPLDLDKPLRILPDKGTNSLIVATVEKNIGPLGSIIELLDSYPVGHDMGLKIFPLKFADAESVRDMLKTMFDEGKKLPERAPGGAKTEAVPKTEVGRAFVYNVGLAVDNRTNTLIVSGRPEQLSLAEMVVAQIDVPVSSVKFPLRLMFLGEHVDATRVGAIVEELFTKRIELLNDTDAGKLAIAREQVFLAVDIRSNALIVSASEQNYQEIERITEKLNVASDRLIDNIRIINCKLTSAADLAGKIDELWQRKANLRREGDIPEDLPVIVADQRSNSLVIASSPEDFKEIKRLVDRLEAQPLSPIAEIRLVTLVNNDATQTSDMLKSLFEERMEQRLAQGQEPNPSDRVAIAVDTATNTMLVASSRENFDEMMRIIEAIDLEPIIEGVVRLFILDRAEASDVADKIKELFDQGLYSPMAGIESQIAEERNKVAIIAEPRINAIIVSASKPNLSIIEKLIERMDGELSPLLSDDTKIIRLEFADAVKLADMLDELFTARQSEAAEPDLYRKPTLLADERSNTLIVSGAPDAMKRCEDLIVQLDRPAGPPSSVFEVYTLKHGSAVKLAAKMQDLFDKRAEGRDESATPINIQADEASNSLIASASRDDHSLIVGLLELLDQPSSIARQFQIFPLKKAKVDKVAETLDQLFQQQAEGGSGRADAIAVQPDERSNSLVVWAARSEMDNITTIIEKLDTVKPAVEMMMKVIRLKQALAEDFADIFEETLYGGDSQGDDESAVIVSFVEKMDDGTEAVRKLLRQDITITPDPRTNSLMVMAPTGSMEMLEAMILDFDRVSPVTAEIRIFPLANADADEMVERLNEIFGTEEQAGDMEQQIQFGAEGGPPTVTVSGEVSGTRTPIRFTADRRTNSVIAAGNPIDLRMAEELIRELDGQDINDRIHDVYDPRYVSAPAIAAAVQEFNDSENELLSELDDEVSIRRRAEKQISVVSDEDSNILLVGASSRNYDQVMDLIRRMDRPEPQVMISVLIAEVAMNDRLELGIEFAAQDLNFSENAFVGNNSTIQGSSFDIIGGTDIGAAGTGFGGLSITVSGEDFSFLFRALESESQLEVLSRPTILVQNNAEGNITIGDRVPIITGSTSAGGQSSTTIQYEDVGIILTVTPHINPDGYVNLEISPEISGISNQSLQVAEGLNAPVFTERSAETTVTIKDGETVILGGLITESVDESQTKVPILGDLPWIGPLFRFDSKVTSKTELLIVLTVNVLRTEEDLRYASEQERDRTGYFPERIKRHPLMQGLRIRAEEDAFGPIDEYPSNQKTSRDRKGAVPQRRDRSIYGPTPRTYGPPRPTAAPRTSASSQPKKKVYGPRLVRSTEPRP
ncbi:MAG: secretin N-terminal domain-containing protein [Phycisphaerae bacterium]